MVHSDYGSESAIPSLSSQVTAPLVINENFHDVCLLLQVVQPCFSPSISSSLGLSSKSFVSQDAPLFESNSFVTLHNLVYATGQPNFLGGRLSVPTLLNLSLWRSLLTEYSDVVVCDYLEFGWPIGYYYHGVLPFSDPRNHKVHSPFRLPLTATCHQNLRYVTFAVHLHATLLWQQLPCLR